MILIKGLEMPKGENGLLCLDIYPDGRVFINLNADKGQVATAEQFKPKHGRWEKKGVSIQGIEKEFCSECKTWSYGRSKAFCPNCGSRNEVEE